MDNKTESSRNTCEGLVRSLARIPSWQAYAMTLIALLGAILFIAGSFWSLSLLQATPPPVHLSTLLMIAGGVCIAMLVPVSFIIYLAKDITSLRVRLEEADKGVRQGARGDANLLHADERDSG